MTLRDREAVGEGYAYLFETMCHLAHIECVTVTGLAKRLPEQIGKVTEKDRHAWNAVQVGGRWYVCDPAWGAGTTDRKVRTFTRSFTDAWFLSDRKVFALCHYPDDKKWQLLDSPLTKPAFTLAPAVGPAAMILQVRPVAPTRGLLRGRAADTSGALFFEVPRPASLKAVSALTDVGTPVPLSWSLDGHLLRVAFIYPEDGSYPVLLHFNGGYAYGYNATVSKAKAVRHPVTPAAPKNRN